MSKYISIADTRSNIGQYVEDQDDSQILQDAYQQNSILLISQNIQDFHIDDIKANLNIDVMTIGGLVQIIRNQE